MQYNYLISYHKLGGISENKGVFLKSFYFQKHQDFFNGIFIFKNTGGWGGGGSG